jgi:hypothetical protein
MSYVSPKPPQLELEPEPIPERLVVATSERQWTNRAIEWLLFEADVVVDGILIRGDSLNPREPVWRQLKRRLRAAGVRCPRSPEELP